MKASVTVVLQVSESTLQIKKDSVRYMVNKGKTAPWTRHRYRIGMPRYVCRVRILRQSGCSKMPVIR